MNDEVHETTEPDDGFEQGLAARLSEVAEGVDRAPSRAGVDGAVGVLVTRQRRVRRAGALAAAAAVLAVAGIAVAGVGDDGRRPVEVATGSSTTTDPTACPEDLDGEELFEVGDPRCVETICTDPAALVLDGIQVAYGYDWGIDLETGELRELDRPFGPIDVGPGLVVLTPRQGSILHEDSVLTVVPRGPEEQVGLVVTREVALDLVGHGEPITAEQLARLHHPDRGIGVEVEQVVLTHGEEARSSGCDEAADTTAVEATATTTPPATSTSTVPETTSVPDATTTAPETTTTTTVAPAHPPALLDLVEGGAAWAVYVAVADGADGSAGSVLDGARARAQAEGYHAEFVNLACDRGAVAGLGLDPAATLVGMALYFTDEPAARAVAGLFDAQVRGPVAVRTHCVDTELDGTPAGESGDSDREQSAPFP